MYMPAEDKHTLMCPQLMSPVQVMAWTVRAEGYHTDSPVHASHMYTVSHTPVHTRTPVGSFLPSWSCIGFLFDVGFVFGCRGSVAAEESDAV